VNRDNRGRWPIEDILARTDLAALLDELAEPATVSTRGRRWHCPVADHHDNHASVSMYADAHGHQRWRCWSGDDRHRGDAIDLLQATRGLNRGDAIEYLAGRAGIARDTPLPPAPPRPPRQPARPIPLDPAVPLYVEACERVLRTTAGRPVRDWLANRGFDEATIRANHLGADPGRRAMYRNKGLPYGTSLGATFPALDPLGTVRYVQTRYLQPEPGGPKYDNPAGDLGTNPRLAWTAAPSHNNQGLLLVCEGIPDALTAAQAGHRSVAVLGSHAPDRSVVNRLIVQAEQHDLTIVAMQDGDPAGRLWANRLGHLLAQRDHDLQVIEPPTPGTDLNDWARHDPDWSQWLPSREQRISPPTPEPTPTPPNPGLEID
jgi:DNA primase